MARAREGERGERREERGEMRDERGEKLRGAQENGASRTHSTRRKGSDEPQHSSSLRVPAHLVVAKVVASESPEASQPVGHKEGERAELEELEKREVDGGARDEPAHDAREPHETQ